MSANPRDPFGRFCRIAIAEYKRDYEKDGAKLGPEALEKALDQVHDTWHRVRTRKPVPKVVSSEAEAIFALYPRKVAKQAALRAILKVLDKVPGDILTERVRVYAGMVARWRKDDRTFVPHPATWFNEGRYDDDPKEWERPNMAPIATTSPAQQPPISEIPNWLERLRAADPDHHYARGRSSWEGMLPFYQHQIARVIERHERR